jgi:hypothetical protein
VLTISHRGAWTCPIVRSANENADSHRAIGVSKAGSIRQN